MFSSRKLRSNFKSGHNCSHNDNVDLRGAKKNRLWRQRIYWKNMLKILKFTNTHVINFQIKLATKKSFKREFTYLLWILATFKNRCRLQHITLTNYTESYDVLQKQNNPSRTKVICFNVVSVRTLFHRCQSIIHFNCSGSYLVASTGWSPTIKHNSYLSGMFANFMFTSFFFFFLLFKANLLRIHNFFSLSYFILICKIAACYALFGNFFFCFRLFRGVQVGVLCIFYLIVAVFVRQVFRVFIINIFVQLKCNVVFSFFVIE